MQLENEKGYWRQTKDFCKRSGSCVQCPRCSYGPVFHDRCLDLTEYHSMALNSRIRIDNSCPSCGWFAVYWNHWSTWDGKFMFEREQLLAGRDSSAAVQPLSKAALARQERQNLNCLVASLRAHAKQCGSCGYGPVLHQFCDMLGTHQGEKVRGGNINNSCPACGWFANSWSEWRPWSGKFGSVTPSKSKVGESNTAEVIANATEHVIDEERGESTTVAAVAAADANDAILQSTTIASTIPIESDFVESEFDAVPVEMMHLTAGKVMDGIKDVAT